MSFNEQNFLTRLDSLITGDGFRQVQEVKMSEWKTAAGLTLTASTAPTMAALETSFYGVQSASSTTDLGSLAFTVPEDYDSDSDELRLRFLCNSAGTTDEPILTATLYTKREGVALATKTGVDSAAVSKTSATTGATWTEIDLDGLSLLPGDAVFAVLTIGAHTTDAINFYGVELIYRSNLAFTDPNDR